MPRSPRYGRMEEPADPKTKRKLELVEKAIKERSLSWQIKTRFGEDRWAVLNYDLQWREGQPGAMIIADRDTDMDVKIYPPGMWFAMDCVIMDGHEWRVFLPHDEYLSDFADRLIEEEERKA